jgi:hypothetical protein
MYYSPLVMMSPPIVCAVLLDLKARPFIYYSCTDGVGGEARNNLSKE